MFTRRSFRSRARYKFDTILARGTIAVILWLGVFTGAVVWSPARCSLCLDIVVHGKRVGVIEGIWQNLLRAASQHRVEGDRRGR